MNVLVMLQSVCCTRTDYRLEVVHRLSTVCDVFVCLLAATTLQSKWVQTEIKLAWESDRPMLPVFQESFTVPDGSDALEPYIEALLNYDGVHLLDHRHIHVDHTIAEVARIVKQSGQRGIRPTSH
jgi:hypothetical protein